MKELFRQFSFPGGIPSHAAPETPGSIHEGGELGYSLCPRVRRRVRQPGPARRLRHRRRRGRDRPAGRSWHCQQVRATRCTTARCCRSCTSTATRSPTPTVLARIPEDELLAAAVAATATGPTSSRAVRRRRPRGRARADGRHAGRDRSPRSPRIRSRQARSSPRRAGRPAALADARAAHAEGLDRAPRGRRRAGRGHVPGAPGAARRDAGEPRAPGRSWRRGCARYRPEELFDDARHARRPSSPPARRTGDAPDERQPARQRRPAAARPAAARLPRYAVDVAEPRSRDRRAATAALGAWLRDVIRREPATFRIVGPDETASNRLQAVFEVTDRQFLGADRADRRAPRPHGRVIEVLSEHLCQGWLEGYLLTGRHGLFNCYEAFIHIVDADVQPARQVARDQPPHPVAAAGRLAELPAVQPRVAPGPQRLLPPGPRLPRPRAEQEARDRAGLPAAGREHPAVHDGPLPAHPRLRQRRRRRQAARARTGCRWTRPIAHCARGIGIWDWASIDAGDRAGRGAGLRGRRPDPRDAGRGRPAAPAPARRCGSGWSTWST